MTSGGANDDLWEVVDATTLGGNASWWGSTTDITNPTATNFYWQDVTDPTGGDTIFNFSNVGSAGTMADSYWSNATNELTVPGTTDHSNWWTDRTTDINDLDDVGNGNFVDTYWGEEDLSTSNTTYWTEYAHANGWNDYDFEY